MAETGNKAKLMVVFCLGFFSLLAQLLLFRDFLSVFEGNELSVGLFFCTWLLWVALGALPARNQKLSGALFPNWFELLVLLYIPAFLLQDYLLLNSRLLAGVSAFEVFPLGKIVPLVFLLNAPVSLITGFLFVGACRWLEGSTLPPARVYIFESLGSFLGAIAGTVLLGLGTGSRSVFTVAALVISGMLFLYLLRSWKTVRHIKLKFVVNLVPLALAVIFLAGGYSVKWQEYDNRLKWEQILPDSKYLGSFNTMQAKYRYGQYGDQFVVSVWDSICETVPNLQSAAETAALCLAQNPNPKRIIVISPGAFSLCRVFAELPGVEQVAWVSPDPEFPARMLDSMPEKFKKNMHKIMLFKGDIRNFTGCCDKTFDLVIFDLPNPASLVMNRYFTLESFQMAKNIMHHEGVMVVRFPGGENFMGPELSYFGASLLVTLKAVFPEIALKPGDSSWFFATDKKEQLTESPKLMAQRLAKTPGLETYFPAQGIYSMYPAERISFQMGKYREVIEHNSPESLLNTDNSPKCFLYTLLLTMKQLGGVNIGVGRMKLALNLVFPLILALILGYVFLRGTYGVFRRKNNDKSSYSPFDLGFFVLASSIVGMVVNILLIFRYQVQFGSIFLTFGIITSLFMLGLFTGGGLMDVMLCCKGERSWQLPVVTAFYAGFLGIVAVAPGGGSFVVFGFYFFFTGVFSGVYLPDAAFYYQRNGTQLAAAGSSLEFCDHIGGAIGGLLGAIVLLPLIGVNMSVFLAVATLIAIIVHAVIMKREAGAGEGRLKIIHVVNYLFALGAVGLMVFYLFSGTTPATPKLQSVKPEATVAAPPASPGTEEPPVAAISRDEESEFADEPEKPEPEKKVAVKKEKSVPRETDALLRAGEVAKIEHTDVDGKNVEYRKITGKDGKLAAYIFSSADFASNVHGFRGPISALIRCNPKGIIEDFEVVKFKEDKKYFDRVMKKREQFLGKNIFHPGAKDKFDAVSGATHSSNGLIRTLRKSGRAFAAKVLKLVPPPVKAVPKTKPVIKPAAKPRNVNIEQIKKLIKSGKLSDKKAWYYRPKQDLD